MTRSILNSQLVLSVETAVAANARWLCPHSYWFLMRILDTDVVFLHCCLAPCQHLLILMVVFILEIMVLLHLKEVEYPLKKVCFSCNNVTYYRHESVYIFSEGKYFLLIITLITGIPKYAATARRRSLLWLHAFMQKHRPLRIRVCATIP